MAFNASFLKSLISAIDVINKRPSEHNSLKKLASIGYPDLLLNNSDIDRLITSDLKCFIQASSPAHRWHGLSEKEYSFFSIEKFLQSINWSFDFLDIAEGTGSNRQSFVPIDLNSAIPSHLYCSYDILIDGGTAEHCFNVGQVFENYFHLLKPGGIVLQYMPFLSPNHGFWSINPTAIYDIASSNPIKVIDCKIQEYISYKHYFDCFSKEVVFNPVTRFGVDLQKNSVTLMFFAYKKIGKSIFRYPTQYKYRK